MKIRVLENYGGAATREYRILPGVYDFSDPALMGIGQMLLDMGKAIEVKDSEAIGLTPPSLVDLRQDPVNPDPDHLPVRLDPAVIEQSEVLKNALNAVVGDTGAEPVPTLETADDQSAVPTDTRRVARGRNDEELVIPDDTGKTDPAAMNAREVPVVQEAEPLVIPDDTGKEDPVNRDRIVNTDNVDEDDDSDDKDDRKPKRRTSRKD